MAGSAVLHELPNLPKLIVFDLDYTLWPLWVDTHVDLPFKKLQNGEIIDRYKTVVELYEDTREILNLIREKGIKIAVASRTGAIDVAENLLQIMELNQYFAQKEIYPGSKVAHFGRFHETLKIPYNEMLFYDDEERNIRDLTRVGVTAIHVPDGISWDVFNKGLKQFSKRCQ